jgi:hypothetical protein
MNTDEWVEQRMGELKPAGDWQPDVTRGLVQLREKQRTGGRMGKRLRWAMTAAATAVCLSVVMPGALVGFAQLIWHNLFLTRVEVVRVNLDDLDDLVPSLRGESVGGPGSMSGVADLDEFERRAGYRPRLPRAEVMKGEPSFTLVSPIHERVTVRVNELRSALAHVGASGVMVPQEWDGATLEVATSALVFAQYSDVQVMQCERIALLTPPGFQTAAFVETVFRILGVGEAEARHMGRRFAEDPAWFFGVPRGDAASVREIQVRGVPAMLIEDFTDDGKAESTAVVWNTPDRTLAVVGKVSRQRAVEVAEAIQ